MVPQVLTDSYWRAGDRAFLVTIDGKPVQGFMVVKGLFCFSIRWGVGLGGASAQRGSALNQGRTLRPYSEKHLGREG